MLHTLQVCFLGKRRKPEVFLAGIARSLYSYTAEVDGSCLDRRKQSNTEYLSTVKLVTWNASMIFSLKDKLSKQPCFGGSVCVGAGGGDVNSQYSSFSLYPSPVNVWQMPRVGFAPPPSPQIQCFESDAYSPLTRTGSSQ